jgi:hypothetical protein
LSWLLLRSCRLFFLLRGWTLSCRLFFFLRRWTRFSLPRLCRSLCAGLGFSYPWPLRFPLLDSLTFLLTSRWPCNALSLTSLCPARLCSLRRPLRLPLLSTFALHSWFRSLLPWRTLLLSLLASNASRRAAGFLNRLTGPDASLRGSRGAPFSRSSGFARGRCAPLLSDPFSWFFGLTTLCLWRSRQTLCWVTRTGARPSRSSWLAS